MPLPMRRLIGITLIFFFVRGAGAQGIFTIGGDVPTPLQISAADLANMPRHQVAFEHNGQSATYDGVLLYDLLVKAGVPFGKAMTGKAMASYLLVTGRDGYEVVFALPELDPKFAGAQVLLADKRNGVALPENEQPFRIIAPQDKMGARSIFSVIKVEVVRLRK